VQAQGLAITDQPRRGGEKPVLSSWFSDLAGEFAEEFVFVHAVFEGFAAVDEDDWDFVGELAAELLIGVDVNFLPVEAAAAMEFGQRLLDDLTKVAAFAAVENDLTGVGHGASLAEFAVQSGHVIEERKAACG
jgi:hypothetical protein